MAYKLPAGDTGRAGGGADVGAGAACPGWGVGGFGGMVLTILVMMEL